MAIIGNTAGLQQMETPYGSVPQWRPPTVTMPPVQQSSFPPPPPPPAPPPVRDLSPMQSAQKWSSGPITDRAGGLNPMLSRQIQQRLSAQAASTMRERAFGRAPDQVYARPAGRTSGEDARVEKSERTRAKQSGASPGGAGSSKKDAQKGRKKLSDAIKERAG